MVLGAWLALASAGLAEDLWEQQPIRYTETLASDPATILSQKLADGSLKLSGATPLARMKEVLAQLHIPEESQLLVFSKTSKQNPLITPWNPRALYFSENAYAGYVPGGEMEVITHDPVLGPVFHLIDLGDATKPPVMTRNTGQCLSCHGTSRTLDVPGVLIRSVFPDADGRPLLEYGSTNVDATTPLEKRWGGYYVTGSSSPPHLGNRKFTSGESSIETTAAEAIASVKGKIDETKYPRLSSDVVALLVIEHQCQVYNLMTAASYRYRRAAWMAKAFDPKANVDRGAAGHSADDDADEIVDALLFRNAAPLGDGVEGDESFQAAFAKQFPVTKDGQSLADFHLGSKLFMNRCSYMVYSQVFQTLPDRLKTSVVKRLREIIESPEGVTGYEYLQKAERQRISAILRETWPAYMQ